MISQRVRRGVQGWYFVTEGYQGAASQAFDNCPFSYRPLKPEGQDSWLSGLTPTLYDNTKQVTLPSQAQEYILFKENLTHKVRVHNAASCRSLLMRPEDPAFQWGCAITILSQLHSTILIMHIMNSPVLFDSSYLCRLLQDLKCSYTFDSNV